MASFNISAVTLAVWASIDLIPASDAQIAAINDLAGTPLPADYTLFLKTYGFTQWDAGTDAYFQTPNGQADIFSMMPAEQIKTSQSLVEDRFLPIAGDYSGHALILMETTPPTGAIWYQYDADDPLLVQPDFAAFLASLGPADTGPAIEKWQGTPVTDARTGFTIASETRAAWAAYDTGSTPEPAEELATIEETLGRTLPEALRTFLTTYGYVTFFGDALARFDLPVGAGQSQDDISVIYSTAVLQRSLPENNTTPLPFASTGLPDGSLLIGMSAEDEGHIYWQATAQSAPLKIAEDLRSFLAELYNERPINE